MKSLYPFYYRAQAMEKLAEIDHITTIKGADSAGYQGQLGLGNLMWPGYSPVCFSWVIHRSFLEKVTSKLSPGGCCLSKRWGRMLPIARECKIQKNGSIASGLKCKQ